MTSIRTLAAAAALTLTLALASPASATDPLAVPNLDNVLMVKGAKPLGFETWTTEGTTVLYMPQRYMMRQCRLAYGRNSETANACKDSRRGVYSALAALR